MFSLFFSISYGNQDILKLAQQYNINIGSTRHIFSTDVSSGTICYIRA